MHIKKCLFATISTLKDNYSMPRSLHDRNSYGTLSQSTLELEFDDDFIDTTDFDLKHSSKRDPRRWSVLEKLDNRHYCRIRSCYDCLAILNLKCVLAIIMLASCMAMVFLFMRAFFFFTDLSYPLQYDIIIVGGGPAGSVVAKRLVDVGARVLMIEAGDATQYAVSGTDHLKEPLTRFDIPLMWTAASQSSQFQWSGFNSSDVLLAKGLGGGGVVGGMVYMRALAEDIAAWGVEGWTWDRMLNKYRDMESFISHSTNNLDGDNNSGGSNSNSISNKATTLTPWFHGSSGPIATTTQTYEDPLAAYFLSAAENSGLALRNDFNDPGTSREGVGKYHVNIADGVRASAASVHLGPLIQNTDDLKKCDFHLALNSVVQRILLKKETTLVDGVETSGYRAVGVEYKTTSKDSSSPSGRRKSEVITAYLSQGPAKNLRPGLADMEGRRTIVLAAGAVMTPKLLMNSGIGPREVLEAASVPVKVESPQVGRNLQDHPMVGMVLTVDAAVAAGYPTTFSFATDWIKYLDAIQERRQEEEESFPTSKTSGSSRSNSADVSAKKRTAVDYGILGSAGFSTGAFLVSPFTNGSVPDIQVTVYPTVSEPHFVSATRGSVAPSAHEMLITVSLLSPEARQQVVLDPESPLHSAPLVTVQTRDLIGVDANSSFSLPSSQSPLSKRPRQSIPRSEYLTALDAKRLAWGVDRVRSILTTKPISGVTKEVSPGPTVTGADLEEWVRSSWVSSSNFVGTARMATDKVDPETGLGGDATGAVLDERLRVRGVSGLMVADASAIPFVPNGNIHATVLAVADVAADFILD